MPGLWSAPKSIKPRRWRHFLRHQRGAVAIEFGLLAIPFFMIVGAILETALVFLSSQVIESAVQDAARLIRTGQAQAAGLNLQGFKNRLCDRTFGLFGDCSGIFLEVDNFDAFQEASIATPVECDDGECEWIREERYLPGVGSDYVVVQAYFRWPTILNFARFDMANLPDGTRLMGGAAVFRSEPF